MITEQLALKMENEMIPSAKLEQIVHWLNEADGLLITAGAGMGVDSGLPDFRGNEGFWQAYPALGRRQLDFSEIANGQAFLEHPELAWGFYGHRLNLYRNTVPHTGFHILQGIAAKLPNGAFVYTSNVDGQFQKAGFSQNQIVECHGSIHHVQCAHACSDQILSASSLHLQIDEDNCLLTSPLPRCHICNGVLRPNILMFNDWTWLPLRTNAQQTQMQIWRKRVQRMVVIELGAGLAIPTVRRFGEKQCAPLIRINPLDANVDTDQRIGLQTTAINGLKQIAQALKLPGYIAETEAASRP